MTQDIKITAHPSATGEVCQFVLSTAVLPEGSVFCTDPEQAKGAPLLEELFALEGVEEILVMGHKINIKKNHAHTWQVLGKEVGQKIRAVLAQGEPFPPHFQEQTPQTRPAHESVARSSAHFDDPLEQKVQRLLQEQISPALAAHGGHVNLVKVSEGIAYLNFGGGCQGCSQASVTVKQGVEKLLMSELSEIKGVVDVTNHSQGDNPYYR